MKEVGVRVNYSKDRDIEINPREYFIFFLKRREHSHGSVGPNFSQMTYEVEQTFNAELDKLLKWNISPDKKTYSLIDSSEERADRLKKGSPEKIGNDDIKIKKKFDFAAAEGEGGAMQDSAQKDSGASQGDGPDMMAQENFMPQKFTGKQFGGSQQNASDVWEGGAKSKLPNSFGILNMPHGQSNLDIINPQANLGNPYGQVYYPGHIQTPSQVPPMQNLAMPNNTGFNPLMPSVNLLQQSANDQSDPVVGENTRMVDDGNLDLGGGSNSKAEAMGFDYETKDDSGMAGDRDLEGGEEDNADLDELLEIFRKSDPEAIKNLVKTLNNSELKKKLVFVIEEYFPNLIHLLEDHPSNRKDADTNDKPRSSQQNSNEKRSKYEPHGSKGPQFNAGSNMGQMGQPGAQGQFPPGMMQNPGQIFGQGPPGQMQFAPPGMQGQFGQGPPNNFIIQQGQPGQQFHGSNMGYQGHKRGGMGSNYQGNNPRYQGNQGNSYNNRNNNNNFHRNQRGGGYMGNQNNNRGGRPHGNFRQGQDFDDSPMDNSQIGQQGPPVNNFQPMFIDQQQQAVQQQIGNNKPQFLGMPQGIVGQDPNQVPGQGPPFQGVNDSGEIQPQGMIGGMGPPFGIGFQGGAPGPFPGAGMGPGMPSNQQFGLMGQQSPVSPSGNTGVPGFLGNLGRQGPGGAMNIGAPGQGISPTKPNLDNSMISGNIGLIDQNPGGFQGGQNPDQEQNK